MEKKPSFLFLKMANTPYKGKTRHISWLASFLFKVQCFYRDENNFVTDYKYYIKREKEHFVFWLHFLKNDNSNCFWYTSSFNWK